MTSPFTTPPPDTNLSDKTFLIVDDFQGMRSIMRDMLRSCGADSKNIVTAANGNEAIDRLAAGKIDIVLCDYNLGSGKNGQQVLEEAKVRQLIGPACIWIMVTAEKTSEAVSGAAEYQPDAYLLKPITEAVLRQRMARLWAKKVAFSAIDSAIASGNYQKAISLCDQRLAVDKANANDLLRTKCDLLISSGDTERARKTFEAILANRDVPWAKVGLAKICIQAGDHQTAKSALEDVLRNNGAYLEAHDLLAKTLQATGELEAAAEVLERAARLSPNSVVRQKNLGEMALKLGRVEHAERAFRKSVSLGEHSILKTPDAYLGLARTCSAKAAPDEALRVLSQLNKTFDDGEARLNALAVEGLVHHQAGNTAKAREIAAELNSRVAEEGAQPDSQAMLDTARLLLATGDKDAAITLLQNEVQNSPENKQLLDEVKTIYADAEMAEEGATLVERSRAEALDMMNRGVLLARDGQYEAAITAMRQAREAMPKNVRVLFNLAHVIIAKLQKTGTDPDLIAEAEAVLASANQMSPGEPRHVQLRSMLETLAQPV